MEIKEEIIIDAPTNRYKLPPLPPRWKRHLALILCAVAVLVSMGIYAYKTQSIMRAQKEMLVEKDKSINFLNQETVRLRNQGSMDSQSLKTQVSEALSRQLSAEQAQVKLSEDNAKLKDLLKQWQAYHERIKNRIQPIPVKKEAKPTPAKTAPKR